MRISDWSSDVCSSDLLVAARHAVTRLHRQLDLARCADRHLDRPRNPGERRRRPDSLDRRVGHRRARTATAPAGGRLAVDARNLDILVRSEEHTSELQSLRRILYAVFCMKKKNEQRLKQAEHVGKRTAVTN